MAKMIAHRFEQLRTPSVIRGVAMSAVLCLLVLGLLQSSIIVIAVAACGALLVFPI
jgi:hypothetical protein